MPATSAPGRPCAAMHCVRVQPYEWGVVSGAQAWREKVAVSARAHPSPTGCRAAAATALPHHHSCAVCVSEARLQVTAIMVCRDLPTVYLLDMERAETQHAVAQAASPPPSLACDDSGTLMQPSFRAYALRAGCNPAASAAARSALPRCMRSTACGCSPAHKAISHSIQMHTAALDYEVRVMHPDAL